MEQNINNVVISFYIPENFTYVDGKNLDAISLEDHQFYTSSYRAWIVQTYLYLKRTMNNVVHSDCLIEDAINIVHCDEMINLKKTHLYFIVTIIADKKNFMPGNVSIVQNNNQIKTKTYKWVMHWPQANLIKSNRGSETKELNIGFLGVEKNSINIRDYISDSKYFEKINLFFKGPGEWHDYSNLDVVVAIRNFSKSESNEKPATKLLNAWKAGVLFIGGNDSAYDQIGKAGLNYIKIDNHKELVASIEEIIENKLIKQEYILQGLEASTKYEHKYIIKQWEEILNIFCVQEYSKWKIVDDKSIVNLTFYHIRKNYVKTITLSTKINYKIKYFFHLIKSLLCMYKLRR